MQRNPVVHIHLEIDKELVREMKILAAKNGQKLWQVYEEALLAYLGDRGWLYRQKPHGCRDALQWDA